MTVTTDFLIKLLQKNRHELQEEIDTYKEKNGTNLLDAQDETGKTLLHYVVWGMIQAKRNSDSCNWASIEGINEKVLVSKSIHTDYVTDIEKILQNKPNFNIRDNLGNTVLHQAFITLLKQINSSSVRALGREQWLPKLITYAISHFDFLSLNQQGFSIVHLCFKLPDQLFLPLQKLLTTIPNIDLDQLSNEGATALYYAINTANFNSAMLLVNVGVNIRRYGHKNFDPVTELNAEYNHNPRLLANLKCVYPLHFESLDQFKKLFYGILYQKAHSLLFSLDQENQNVEEAYKLFQSIPKDSKNYSDAQYCLAKIICFYSNFTPEDFAREPAEDRKERIKLMLPFLKEAAQHGHELAKCELDNYQANKISFWNEAATKEEEQNLNNDNNPYQATINSRRSNF